jgi:hypothetical protein
MWEPEGAGGPQGFLGGPHRDEIAQAHGLASDVVVVSLESFEAAVNARAAHGPHWRPGGD